MVRLPFTSAGHLSDAVRAVREAVASHGVVALPTESSYGLAVDPWDALAVERIFEIKGRPPEKALLVVGASLAQLEHLVEVPPPWRERLLAAWPAPVTVVLRSPGGLAAAGGGFSLAVRVPAHELLRGLLEAVGPLTATSANRSGGPALLRADDVAAALGQGVTLLLDGGATPGGAPSTVVDLTADPPTVLRTGAWRPPAAWGVSP
ncbi:MAG TPA: L-threonylcarbamoyladenylate synthase [Thermoanaerobaculaceae bacterium]|nr:L-threonylcarbamoyladenylate synthase [Thermoanaerobaculaceae bacterium]